MRVGFEAKRFFHNRTGLGNYARWTVECLSTLSDVEVVLFSTAIKTNPKDSKPYKSVSPKYLGALWRSVWQWLSWRRHNIDVYHGLSSELPLGCSFSRIPTVVTVHDLLFLKHPEHYSWANRVIYTFKTKYACRVATKIVAISQATRQDLIELFGIEPSKVLVIPQGCGPQFTKEMQPDKVAQTLKKRGLICGTYALHVGSLSPRKGQETLIRSMHLWSGQLVLVGRGNNSELLLLRQLANELGVVNRVCFLQDVDDSELPILYHGAGVFVYPSMDEGFGIPILEALSCGIPVITSDRPSMREAGGNVATYIGPFDIQAIGNEIGNALAKRPEQGKLADQTAQHLAQFQPKNVALQWLALYKSLI